MEYYPVELELNIDSKPVLSQPYPVPRVHKAIFRKELDRLVLLGVIKEANNPEWGAPYFAQPKPKTDCIIFLSEFWNLKRQLKRKPYTMPKIHEMLSKLEFSQYYT